MTKDNQNQTKKFDSSNFEQEVLNYNGVVLVDFYADWCGPCKMLAPELEILSHEYAGNNQVKIGKLDTDANMELAQAYKIQSIPNVIVFKNGKPVEQIIGLRRKSDYQQAIAKALETDMEKSV